MISGANVLILDEPTDHLDMEAITALNNGMIKFPGVMLFASRDHQVVQTTANRIMEIVPGGKLIDKITTYDEYLDLELLPCCYAPVLGPSLHYCSFVVSRLLHTVQLVPSP